MSMRRVADEPLATQSTAAQPHHRSVRAGFVDEHQPRQSNMPCSRIQRRRARATSARFCSAAYRVFFEADVAASEEPPHRAAAACDPAFAHRRDDLVQRQVPLFAIRPSRNSACCSSGEMLPPLGFAAALPVSSKLCTQITTTLGLIP